MNKRRMRKLWMLPVFTLALVFVIGLCWKTNVFGKFLPQEPFVEGEPEIINNTLVTNEGSNLKGEEGSGAKPCSQEVPTCVGKKGSETNPFVILEVVADHAQQQMSYLAMEKNSDTPLDIMKIGIELADKAQRSYVPGNNNVMSRTELMPVGEWFSRWEYKVKPIGATGLITEEKDMVSEYFVDFGKLYSLKITSEDLKKAGVEEEEFKKMFDEAKDEGKSGMFTRPVYNHTALMKKYPELFEKDNKEQEIRKIAKEDYVNWQASRKTEVVKEAEAREYFGSGFILAVAPGKGEFSFVRQESDGSTFKRVFEKTKTDADRWIYVENEKDLPPESVIAYENNKARINDYGFYNHDKQIWYAGIDELISTYRESDDITGMYMKLSDSPQMTCQYVITPEEKSEVYSFDYYGLHNNDILKRQLFQFKTQKECDDFHMKVVCMTPSELNEMAKKDTNQTLDMIERADMFYIAGYAGEGGDETAALEETYNLYYKYVKGKEDYKYDKTKVASFFDDDLEWDLCYKLLFRLCHNKNLPLVITNTVGKLASESVANVRMYQSEQHPNVERGSILSNLGKLYIITTQFDLTAKRAEDETYVRTFYDDILDKLQRIPLAEAGKNSSAFSPIQYTGYYRRPKVIDSDDVAEREKCFYLWNNLTFFPEALGNLFYNDQQVSLSDENREQLRVYGYLPSYFDTTTSDKTFTDASQAEKAPGSDGHTGNVGIPHNANNGAYYSTLLGNAESSYVTNTTMNTAFLIMNNRPEVVNPQVVKLMRQKKEYVRMSDVAALVDYSSEQTYQPNDKSYLKVLIHNNNNGQAGVVTKVTLINEQGQPAPADSDLKLYTAKDYLEECGKAKYGIYEGYDIPDGESVIAYVPYSQKQWADGYNTVEFETVGRIYSEKKKKIIYGKPTKTNISINERTLFNLD